MEINSGSKIESIQCGWVCVCVCGIYNICNIELPFLKYECTFIRYQILFIHYSYKLKHFLILLLQPSYNFLFYFVVCAFCINNKCDSEFHLKHQFFFVRRHLCVNIMEIMPCGIRACGTMLP